MSTSCSHYSTVAQIFMFWLAAALESWLLYPSDVMPVFFAITLAFCHGTYFRLFFKSPCAIFGGTPVSQRSPVSRIGKQLRLQDGH